MHRRSFFLTLAATTAGLLAAPARLSRIPQAQGPPTAGASRTRWLVRASEGFDAIAFLGPLAGGSLYTRYYAADVAAFAPRLPAPVRHDVAALWAEAGAAGVGLLGPALCTLCSTGGNDRTLDTLLAALAAPDARILPAYYASPYWKADDWRWFTRAAPRLTAVFAAMRDAGFARFRAERAGDLAVRVGEVRRALGGYDVIAWHEKLTGRSFDPTVEVVLLQFAKPHGIKVQGQTFLQAADYDTATTVRVAAHEMLHPPVRMDGPAARAALAVLARDPLIPRIVREHDPRWGYTLLDEDLVEALDQLISESLGVARNPADRWRKADDGMHVLAGGLYGLLRQDRWVETGGSPEAWLADAARRGRLAPAVLHAAAGRVLERSVDRLWPLAVGAG